MANVNLAQSDDQSYILSGGYEADQHQRELEQAAADAREALWTEFDRLLRNEYLLWAPLEDGNERAWGKVADLVAMAQRWPHLEIDEEKTAQFLCFVQQFAASEGWPDVWRCYARTLQTHEAQAERAKQLLEEGRY